MQKRCEEGMMATVCAGEKSRGHDGCSMCIRGVQTIQQEQYVQEGTAEGMEAGKMDRSAKVIEESLMSALGVGS